MRLIRDWFRRRRGPDPALVIVPPRRIFEGFDPTPRDALAAERRALEARRRAELEAITRGPRAES